MEIRLVLASVVDAPPATYACARRRRGKHKSNISRDFLPINFSCLLIYGKIINIRLDVIARIRNSRARALVYAATRQH